MNPLYECVLDSDDLVLGIDINANPENGQHNIWNASMALAHPSPDHGTGNRVCVVQSTVGRTSHITGGLHRAGVLGRAFNRLMNRPEDSSVIQGPGRKILNGFQVHLLRLNKSDGYLVDAGGNALLQNKHGNPELKRKYTEERKNLFIRKWTGGSTMDDLSLYRIRARLHFRRARSVIAKALKIETLVARRRSNKGYLDLDILEACVKGISDRSTSSNLIRMQILQR